MDDDTFQDMYNDAIQVGLDNFEILKLAAAWCENVGQTSGPLGIGDLQAATGLPITGGSLRCEYATAPTSFGASLTASSVEFYERNCIGCPHRKPTGATEHLGTYADGLIGERKEWERQVEQARLERAEARRQRQEDRRFGFGAPDPTGQSILDLIDRVDGEDSDPEAEELLLRHAEMSPDDFSDELLAHLTDEAIAIGNSPLLESVIAVFERDGRPGVDRMLEVAFGAMTAGVARVACGRVIATNAQTFPADDEPLIAIMVLAAGGFDFGAFGHRARGEPAALLRLYDIDRDRATAIIGAQVRNDDPSIRSAAAHAADSLVAARPDAGALLLGALLDAVLIPDKSATLGDPFASSQACNVVGDILVGAPVATAAAIDARMMGADVRTANKIWCCYDTAARSSLHEPLPAEAGAVIGARAAALLAADNLDIDLRCTVTDTLSLLCRYHSAAVTVPISELIGLISASAERFERFDQTPPDPSSATTQDEALIAHMGWESGRIRLNSVIRKLEDSLEALAEADVTGFVQALVAGEWAAAQASSLGRAALLKVLGSVIQEQADLDSATPMLLEAIDSDRNWERAAGYEALGEIARHDVTLPVGSAESVIKALDDQYLIIYLAAVRVLPRIEVPKDGRVPVILKLVGFAAAYGPDRAHTEDVRTALGTARRLGEGQPFQGRVEEMVLGTIATFPSAEAVQILERLRVDHGHPSWPPTIIAALRPDPDPQWDAIPERGRADLLRELAGIDTHRLVPHFDELEQIGKQRIPYDSSWAWAVSDVLARHGEHGRAAVVCDAVVDAMPDTIEFGPRRTYARQTAIGHHTNVAIERGDTAALVGLLKEWSGLSAGLKD